MDADPRVTAALDFILNLYKDKNFVQRIQDPNRQLIQMGPQGPGTVGSHLMVGSDLPDGTNIAYPEIVQKPGGQLQRLSPQEAYEYALQSREYIPFVSQAAADWFGANYKKASTWGNR